MKPCVQCGQSFVPKNNSHKYCSEECADAIALKQRLAFYYRNRERVLRRQKLAYRRAKCIDYTMANLRRTKAAYNRNFELLFKNIGRLAHDRYVAVERQLYRQELRILRGMNIPA